MRASRRWPVICATVASALAVLTGGALAQSANPQSTTSGASPACSLRSTDLEYRVTDVQQGRGPANFADLAEKVGPAVITVSTTTAHKIPPDLRSPGEDPGDSGDEPDGDGPPLLDRPDQRLDQRRLGPRQGSNEQGSKEIATTSMGAGFFISPDGYAVTTDTILEDSDTVQIRTSDRQSYVAKVVGRDPLSNLALIKVDGRDSFSYAKLADQSPRIGDWVLAVGNSLGLGESVMAGIVSARERDLDIDSGETFIQIDAPINRGDSGGPSFNTQGEVVGVNSIIISPSGGSTGVAFAIPADTVRTVIPQLKDKGAVRRGWIGVEVESITPDIAETFGKRDLQGAIVVNIQDNTPASRDGLKIGDVISSIDETPVRKASDLTKRIHAMPPGSKTRLTVLRQGGESAVDVTLGELPSPPTTPTLNR